MKFVPEEIEHGILPLVEAMNRLPYLRTTESCAGHPSQKGRPWFWTRGAFVSFEISDEGRWKKVLIDFVRWAEKYGGYVYIQKHFEVVKGELKGWWILIIQPTRSDLTDEEYRAYFDERIKDATEFFQEAVSISQGNP